MSGKRSYLTPAIFGSRYSNSLILRLYFRFRFTSHESPSVDRLQAWSQACVVAFTDRLWSRYRESDTKQRGIPATIRFWFHTALLQQRQRFLWPPVCWLVLRFRWADRKSKLLHKKIEICYICLKMFVQLLLGHSAAPDLIHCSVMARCRCRPSTVQCWGCMPGSLLVECCQQPSFLQWSDRVSQSWTLRYWQGSCT